MKKFLIATHGHLASGFKSALDLLYSEDSNIAIIDAYIDDTNISNAVLQFIDSISSEDTALIFTDLKCGSVNQLVTNVIMETRKNIFVITGVNLPVILEIMLTNSDINAQYLSEVVELAKQEIELIDFGSLSSESDEDDFLD